MGSRSALGNSEHMNLSLRDTLYVNKVNETERTFDHDDHLPSLPVPPLDQTLEKYLDSVKALVSEEEYQNTVSTVRNFQNGIGRDLHLKLVRKSHEERNWLERWWEDLAYLSQRTPLLPLCSMVGVGEMNDVWCYYSSGSQIEHAALYLHYQLSFWKLLRKEKLKPHFSHNTQWSMDQFRRYFSTVRIPGENIDKLECHFHTESEDESSPTHITILHHGHIFTFDAVDEYGEILSPPEISLQLTRIKDWCKDNGWGSGVGSLTVEERSTWARHREWLLKLHPENVLHMDTISTSLIVVSLDDDEPKDQSEVCKASLASNCCSRWADKSVADVFFGNGSFGKISDHTPFDGLVAVVVGHYTYLSLKECGGVWKGPKTVDRDLLPPRRLDFYIDEHIKNAINEAQIKFQQMADDTDITCQPFTHYGKAFLKPHNIHPETYIQFALQLAYYTMHGRLAPCYVTASTRQFYHGRTETLRSCFPELAEWVKVMAEDTKSLNEKMTLMRKAVEKFKDLMKDCMNNSGCDRHLLGLYMISVEEGFPVPDIFMDPSWIKSGGSGNFVLSTSCCGYTPLTGCVMPMTENGYGTFYSIENKRFTFTISAFNRCVETNSAKFFQYIERALLSMEHLLTSARL